MSTIQDLVEHLEGLLEADTLWGSTKFDGRIYHMFAPQNTAQPLMIFQVNDSPVTQYLTTGGPRVEVEIDFDIYVKTERGTSAASGLGTLEDDLFGFADELDLSGATGWGNATMLVTVRGARTIDEDTIRSTMRTIVRGYP